MKRDRTGPSKRVLIVGCGYIGCALGIRLTGQGHVVWGLRRDVDKLPRSVNALEADLMVPNTLRHLPDVDYVYYLAGSAGVAGLRYFLSAVAALRLKPKSTVFASDVSVYGDRGGEWVDEDSAIDDKVEAEEMIRGVKLRTSVVRIGEVYGPERLGLLADVLGNRPLEPAELGRHVNLVHRDDCVGALAHLLDVRRPEPCYLVVDRAPTEVEEVRRWLAVQLARPEPAYAAERGETSRADVRAMSERLVEAGYKFRYPTYRQGFATLMRGLR